MLGLAAATAATSASCSPGSAIVVRSSPSVSNSALVPDDHHGDVGRRSRLDRPGDRIAGLDGPGAERHAADQLVRNDRVVDVDLVRPPGFELDRGPVLGAAEPEERAAVLPRGDVDQRLAVEPQRERADGVGAELPGAGVVRRRTCRAHGPRTSGRGTRCDGGWSQNHLVRLAVVVIE